MKILDIVPCHRLESRSLKFRGKKMPLCARCTTMLLGFLGIPILLACGLKLPLYLGVVFQIPMLIDGFTQKWKWRKSNNTLRVITGLISGFGMSILVVSGAFLISEMLLKIIIK